MRLPHRAAGGGSGAGGPPGREVQVSAAAAFGSASRVVRAEAPALRLPFSPGPKVAATPPGVPMPPRREGITEKKRPASSRVRRPRERRPEHSRGLGQQQETLDDAPSVNLLHGLLGRSAGCYIPNYNWVLLLMEIFFETGY